MDGWMWASFCQRMMRRAISRLGGRTGRAAGTDLAGGFCSGKNGRLALCFRAGGQGVPGGWLDAAQRRLISSRRADCRMQGVDQYSVFLQIDRSQPARRYCCFDASQIGRSPCPDCWILASRLSDSQLLTTRLVSEAHSMTRE